MNRDIQYLELIIKSIQAIIDYLKDIEEDEFYRDEILKHAVLMQLIIIGEYGGKISDNLKQRFSNIEWQQMKAARNFYVHTYDGINWMYVWETVQQDVKPLLNKIEQIIVELNY
jgi:uncharacterized protein with HEPN domain